MAGVLRQLFAGQPPVWDVAGDGTQGYCRALGIAVGGGPPVPAGLAAAPGTGNTSVTWSSSVGALTYDLRWSPDNATWTNITNVTSPYTDTGAKTNIGISGQLFYQVRANNAGGSSLWSASSTPVGLDILSFSPSTWIKSDGTKFQDFAGTTPAVADGDPVGLVNDAGLGGHNAGQATVGNRTTLKLAIQNGQPVFRGAAGQQFFIGTVSAFNTSHNGVGGTIFFAGKKTGADGTTCGLYGDNDGTGAKVGACSYMVGGNLVTLVSNGSAAVVNQSIPLAINVPFVFVSRYQTGASPAPWRGRINGNVDTTSAEGATPSAGNSGNGYGVGSLSSSNAFVLLGDTYEHIVFPSSFSDANAALLMGSYGRVRWGTF